MPVLFPASSSRLFSMRSAQRSMYGSSPGPPPGALRHPQYAVGQAQSVQQLPHQFLGSVPAVGVPVGCMGISQREYLAPAMGLQGIPMVPQSWPQIVSRGDNFQHMPQWGYAQERVAPSGMWHGGAPFLGPEAHRAPDVHRPPLDFGVSGGGGPAECRAGGSRGGNSGFRGGRSEGRGMGMGRGRGISGGRTSLNNMALRPPASRRSEASAPSQAKELRCQACEKTFIVASQMTAHLSTHVQCEEPGCSFSASGKMVKEHRQTVHGKRSGPLSATAVKAAALRSKETEDEVRRWREERKKNYPTPTNIQRKAEEIRSKEARGELIDEDARKRRQRLKEVLARQAELGVPVAEVPAYYMSDHYDTFGAGRGRGRGHRDHSVDGHPRPVAGGTIQSQVSNGSLSTPSTLKQSPANGVKRERSNNEDIELRERNDGREDEEQPAKLARVHVESSAVVNGSMQERPANVAHVNVESSAVMNGSMHHAPRVVSTGDIVAEGAQVLQEEISTVGVSGSASIVDSSKKEELKRGPRKTSDQPCYFHQRGLCKKGARCHYVHDRRPRGKAAGDKGLKDGKGGNQRVGLPSKRPPTLLAKLLDSGIRRDKSHILQCFRFFVNNSFLLEWPANELEFFDWVTQEAASGDSVVQGSMTSSDDVLAADAAVIDALHVNGEKVIGLDVEEIDGIDSASNSGEEEGSGEDEEESAL